MVDKLGRKHYLGDAWHQRREEVARERAAGATSTRTPAPSVPPLGVSTRQRADPIVQRLALRAADAGAAENELGKRERRHRSEVAGLEDEMQALQHQVETKNKEMAGLHNHIARLREKEAAALDAKRQAELLVAKARRHEEELQLEMVKLQAAKVGADEACARDTAEARRQLMLAAKAAASAEAYAAEKAAKVETMTHRCAQLSGRIGGMRSKPRTADDVAGMAAETVLEKGARRSAKYRCVKQLASAIEKQRSQPTFVAQALVKSGALKSILKETLEGSNILFSHGLQLARTLQDVWDKELSTEFKIELGLTDWQLEEMRLRLSYEWRDGGWHPREWFRNPQSGKVVNFPAPVLSKHQWRPMFIELCKTQKIDLLSKGTVAQRGFKHALALLLTRCDSLLPPPEAITPETPVVVSLGWDALKHAGRHITHGGVKLATFRSDVASSQSELNFVSTNVFRDNDDHYGLVRGLGQWAPALNEAKRRKVFERTETADVVPEGALPVGSSSHADDQAEEDPELATARLPRPRYDMDYAITLDLSALRSICNRAKGCASHCECDTGENKLERNKALHTWPELNDSDSWAVIKRKLSARCTLLTKERRMRLTHHVPPGHDWQRNPKADCDECEWTATKQQYLQELAHLHELEAKAKKHKEARKKLDKLRKVHRAKHFEAELPLRQNLLHEFDSLEFVTDMMHGMPLNI